MAYESKKQEETRKYILRKIALDDQEFLSKTMDGQNLGLKMHYLNCTKEKLRVWKKVIREKKSFFFKDGGQLCALV